MHSPFPPPMQFWALRKLRIKEEKGFVTTQKNNLKKKRNRWKQNVKIRLCITCDRSHRLQLVYKKRKQDQPCFQGLSSPSLVFCSRCLDLLTNRQQSINAKIPRHFHSLASYQTTPSSLEHSS